MSLIYYVSNIILIIILMPLIIATNQEECSIDPQDCNIFETFWLYDAKRCRCDSFISTYLLITFDINALDNNNNNNDLKYYSKNEMKDIEQETLHILQNLNPGIEVNEDNMFMSELNISNTNNNGSIYVEIVTTAFKLVFFENIELEMKKETDFPKVLIYSLGGQVYVDNDSMLFKSNQPSKIIDLWSGVALAISKNNNQLNSINLQTYDIENGTGALIKTYEYSINYIHNLQVYSEKITVITMYEFIMEYLNNLF